MAPKITKQDSAEPGGNGRNYRANAKGKSDEELLDIKSLRVLWERKAIIVLVMIPFLLLAVFQIRRTTPIYTSEAVLRYEPASGQAVDFGERSRMMYSRDEIRTISQLIRTPAIANEVLAALDEGTISEAMPRDRSPLESVRSSITGAMREVRSRIVTYSPPKVDQERLAQQNAARGILNTVNVYVRPDTRLIEVRVSMSDAARAERVCDEFCRQFIRRMREERRETFGYAREFLSQQIASTRMQLEEAENALFDYGGQSDMSLLEGDREIALSTLRQLNSDIERHRNEIALLEAEADPEVASAAARQSLATDRAGTTRSLMQRRDELLIQVANLRAENNEDFQPIVRLRREIDALEEQVASAEQNFIEAYIASRESNLITAQRRLAALESRLAEHELHVQQVEQKMIRFRVLQREIESTHEIYNALLDRFKRLEVTDEAAIGTVTIESPASIPTVPSAPNVSRTLMSFLAFGFAFGCGVVLLMSKLDRTIKDPAVVEASLGLPALAHIPCLRGRRDSGLLGRRGGGEPLLAPFEGKNAAKGIASAEAFRYLRTSINYSSADKSCKVLLMTSCLPSEGKSTISANLGIFFAEPNQKVLIIDGDLKRPNQHKMFSIPRTPGLSDVLTGQATFDDAVFHSPHKGLDVLAAGAATPSPASLLESQAMKDLLAQKREEYDIIIVDSSPTHGIADALVLARMTDAVMLTVRQGHTPMDILARVTEKLESIDARIVGVIYNSTEPAPLGLNYGGYYGKYTYGADAKS